MQLLHRAAFSQRFLLRQHLERSVFRLRLKFLEMQDRLPDGLVVGEHAAEPALVDIGHAYAFGLFPDDLCGGALGADKQDFLVCRDQSAHVVERLVERGQRVFEIDYVNLVASTENVRCHLRIPKAGLVAEMGAGRQHVAHAYRGHQTISGLVHPCDPLPDTITACHSHPASTRGRSSFATRDLPRRKRCCCVWNVQTTPYTIKCVSPLSPRGQ